jgi:hypothetical protein
MRLEKFMNLIFLISLFLIPLNCSVGWYIHYSLRQGDEIPFDHSVYDGYGLRGAYLFSDWESLNLIDEYRFFNQPIEFDLDNYFYLLVSGYDREDQPPAKILSLSFAEGRYEVHMKITKKAEDPFVFCVMLFPYIFVLQISRLHFETTTLPSSVVYYISDLGYTFVALVFIDFIVIVIRLFLKLKKSKLRSIREPRDQY